MSNIRDRALHSEQVVDEELVRVNVGFKINGTSNPLIANNIGDMLINQQVTRVGAGHFTFSLNRTALQIYAASVSTSISGGTTQMTGQIDVTSDPTTGSYIVWTQTGATATDPPTGSMVYVELLLKCVSRKAQL